MTFSCMFMLKKLMVFFDWFSGAQIAAFITASVLLVATLHQRSQKRINCLEYANEYR